MTKTLTYLKRTKKFYESLNQNSSLVKELIINIDNEIQKLEDKENGK